MMLGSRFTPRPRNKDEGEKPFWISYADLMTALMILFLVVMAASLLMVTKRINEATAGEKTRSAEISSLCQKMALDAKGRDGTIQVDCQNNRINFGEAGRFGYNDFRLKPEGLKSLQTIVPLILAATESGEGKKWLKQVVIEGFTDTDGSYLYNLHLSLQRSEWLMCALLDDRYSRQIGLSEVQKKQVRKLFLAGGVSFNNAKTSKEASRRIELRLQFYGLKESHDTNEALDFNVTKAETCQL